MSETDSTILWRGMTRAELDRGYDNTAAVANSGAIRGDFERRSVAFRAARLELLDRRYGPRERNRIDIFRCGAADAPLLVFIHGGYWQRNSKETFSVVAAGPLARGLDVAMLGYTLAPEATLTEIVAEIREAIRFLRQEGPGMGVATGSLIVSGWSAGGHLTATAMAMREVDGGLAVSGIFDVEPCRLNYLNDKLRLTADEARAMSPLLHLPDKAGPLICAYGGDELPELQRQSRDFGAAWQAHGLPGRVERLDGKNHFTIMHELEAPDGVLTALVVELSGQAGRGR